jgi:tRNA A37 threonylcarbamoyladenosine synthetase subunit TsaC/SUA5/YrdC
MIDKETLFLTQTDTTVGFLSQSQKRLAEAKKRNINQPFLSCVDTFLKQKKLARTPKKFRSLVRRSTKTTFLYPNKKAIRVVKDFHHNQLLKRFDFLYSTSANEHKKPFSLSYCIRESDIMIIHPNGFHEMPPSPILKLSKNKISPLR